MISLFLSERSNARLNCKTFIKTDDELILDITSKYNLTNGVVSLMNGNEKAKLNYTRNLTVPRELVFAGRLYIVVELYDGDKVIKKWNVEPIVIYERDASFELESWVNSIEARLAAVEENQKILM